MCMMNSQHRFRQPGPPHVVCFALLLLYQVQQSSERYTRVQHELHVDTTVMMGASPLANAPEACLLHTV